MTTSSPTSTANRIVVIPCGGKKADRPAAAGDMYTGSYHKACRRAADALVANGGRVLILSALYGLLELGDEIQPYDLRMGQAGSVKPARLVGQAAALDLLDAADVIVLGGRKYVDAAAAVWPGARRPLDGCTGMGKQLTRLAAIARGELDIDAPAETDGAKRGGRPAAVDGPKPARSVRAGAAWDAAKGKARALDYPFADVVDELLTLWTDGKVATMADRYPYTLDQVADELGAPRADVDVLVGQIADDADLFDGGRLSRYGRDVIAEAWTPAHITVEIAVQAGPYRGAGQPYQVIEPAESTDTEAAGYTGQGLKAIAQSIADGIARDPHGPVDAGAGFRVRVWRHADADTTAEPAAAAYRAARTLPQLPGCGGRSAVRVEAYSPRESAHGDLTAAAYACEQHGQGVVDALHAAGFTPHREATSSVNECGYRVDFTGPHAVFHHHGGRVIGPVA